MVQIVLKSGHCRKLLGFFQLSSLEEHHRPGHEHLPYASSNIKPPLRLLMPEMDLFNVRKDVFLKSKSSIMPQQVQDQELGVNRSSALTASALR